jgi:hypothetical protein
MLATGHSHSPSYSSTDLHPPRPESPYSAASSYAPSQTTALKKPKKPGPQTSAVMATVGLLNALNPHGSPQPSPPAVAQQQHSQQLWVEEHASDGHMYHQDDRREKKPGFWSRDSDRNKERDKGKGRDVNDPTDLIRMIGKRAIRSHGCGRVDSAHNYCDRYLTLDHRIPCRNQRRRLDFRPRSLRTNKL